MKISDIRESNELTGCTLPEQNTEIPPWLCPRLIAVAGELRRTHGERFARGFLEDLGIVPVEAPPTLTASALEASC